MCENAVRSTDVRRYAVRDILVGNEAAVTDLDQRERVGAPGDRRSRPVALAIGVFAVLVVALTVVAAYAAPYVIHPRAGAHLDGPGWLDAWMQYDSNWYYGIATVGYSYTPGQQSPIAFFPTYPMIVRGVASLIGGDAQIAGTIVTVLAGAAAAALFALWTSARLSPRATRTSVLLLLLYPYTFFIVATMYADAVFLLTVIGAFVLLERGHPWLAGLVGALATAGRPVGIAVAVGLVVRMLELRVQARAGADCAEDGTGDSGRGSTGNAAQGADGQVAPVRFLDLVAAVRHLRLRDVGVAVSALGFVGWCTYLWVSFGDPLAFLAAEASPGWDQGSGPRTWFKAAFVGQLLRGPVDLKLTLGIQALFCLGAVLLLRRVWQRFGWGYLAFCVVVLAIPLLGTKDFMGTGRYLLAAFPVIAAAGELLASSRHGRWLRPLVFTVFAVGLVVGTSLYARGYEVS